MFLVSCGSSQSLFTGQVIELHEKNEMHFLDITLNGIKTKLLIDTGASKSLLDISQADTYDFKYVLLSEDQYVGLGGLVDIYIIYDYDVEAFFIPFLGSDLSEIQNYFIKDGIHIAGILGSDFLEKSNAIIDFKTNQLYLK